jgi:hypothetical protein
VSGNHHQKWLVQSIEVSAMDLCFLLGCTVGRLSVPKHEFVFLSHAFRALSATAFLATRQVFSLSDSPFAGLTRGVLGQFAGNGAYAAKVFPKFGRQQ